MLSRTSALSTANALGLRPFTDPAHLAIIRFPMTDIAHPQPGYYSACVVPWPAPTNRVRLAVVTRLRGPQGLAGGSCAEIKDMASYYSVLERQKAIKLRL